MPAGTGPADDADSPARRRPTAARASARTGDLASARSRCRAATQPAVTGRRPGGFRTGEEMSFRSDRGICGKTRVHSLLLPGDHGCRGGG
jgi:hypothetical protein